jgi:hypothetical protein
MRPILGCTLFLAVLSSVACHTMKPVSLEQINLLKPDRAWVTDVDQSVVVVSRPQVVGGALAGYVNGTYATLPSAGLKQVSVQRSAPTRTAMLAVGIAATFGGAFFAIAGGGSKGQEATIGWCVKYPENPGCVP